LSRRTAAYGAGAAAGSVLGVFLTFKSLELLPETAVFPVSLGGPVMVGLVLSVLLFREKPSLAGCIGVVVGLIGLVVTGIGSGPTEGETASRPQTGASARMGRNVQTRATSLELLAADRVDCGGDSVR